MRPGWPRPRRGRATEAGADAGASLQLLERAQGGGPGAAERGTPVSRSPGAPAAGQLRGRAGRGLDSPPAGPGSCRGADEGCRSPPPTPPSPLGLGSSGQQSFGRSSRSSAPFRGVTGCRARLQAAAERNARCSAEPRDELLAAGPV